MTAPPRNEGLVDVSALGVHWRGHPVAAIDQPVITTFPEFVLGPHALLHIVADAVDLAEPDEPSGWRFEATYQRRRLWLERSGGVVDLDTGRHDGGYWTLCFREDR